MAEALRTSSRTTPRSHRTIELSPTTDLEVDAEPEPEPQPRDDDAAPPVDSDSPAGRAATRAAARAELSRIRASDGGEAGSPEAAAKAYRKLSDMRTSQLQQRMQALSQRDPRLGVQMVLSRSPQTSKEQAMRALRHSNGDVERAILRLSEPELLSEPSPEPSPQPPPEIQMTLPKDIDLDVTPKKAAAEQSSDSDDEAAPDGESARTPRRSPDPGGSGSRFRRAETGSLAVARQQIRRLEAQARRLQAIAELEKQEKMILIEDMNTMHRAQKEQIEQDRRHLQQMDETNEQLCQDLIQAEAELTLLRSSSRRDAGAAGGASGAVDADDEFDVDEPSGSASKAAVAGVAGVMTTPPRQSSAEMEAALAWQEKAALEEVLADTQRQLGAHPPPSFATLPSLPLQPVSPLFSVLAQALKADAMCM